MKDEQFLKNIARLYEQETGEALLRENAASSPTPTPELDAKMRQAIDSLPPRRLGIQRLYARRGVWLGIAASIVLMVAIGLAFLPDFLDGGLRNEMDYHAPMADTAPAPTDAPQAESDTAPAAGEAWEASDSDDGMWSETTMYDFNLWDTLPDYESYPLLRQQNIVGAAPETPAEDTFAASPPMVGIPSRPEPEMDMAQQPNRQARSLYTQAITEFSQNLFRQVLATGNTNPVVSPLSAYYALAMAAQGAGGVTQAEFRYLLNSHPQDLPYGLYHLAEILTTGNTKVNIANSVWINNDFYVHTQFDRISSYFGAPAYSRDFDSPATVDEINAWVYDQTQGLIEEIVTGFSPDDIMLIINALYFFGRWPEPMDDMTPSTFYTENGERIDMNFLSTNSWGGEFLVTQNDELEAAFLPYDCGRFGFMLARPVCGTPIRDFAAMHDITGIIDNLQPLDGIVVQMPPLDLAFAITMNDILQDMGLHSAFCKQADFSALVVDPPMPPYISEVLQKSRIIVDRYGTEAAAVTSVRVTLHSLPPPTTVLNFNSPYVFVIYDLYTAVPLFMGVVDDPR